MTRVFYGTQRGASNKHSERNSQAWNPRSHHRHTNYERPSPPRQHKIPEEFFSITKKHFIILKCVHHQCNLENGFPPSLVKKTDLLTQSVNPAFKDDTFRSRLEAVSSEWCGAVHQAMKEHYASLVDQAINFISNNGIPSDLLERSLQLTIRWARTHLGRKLKDVSLDKAISLIKCHQLIVHPSSSSAPDLFQTDSTCSHPITGFRVPVPIEPSSFKEIFDRGTQTDPSCNVSTSTLTSLEVSVGLEVPTPLPAVLPMRSIPSENRDPSEAFAPCLEAIPSSSTSALVASPESLNSNEAFTPHVDLDDNPLEQNNPRPLDSLVQTKIVDLNTLSSKDTDSVVLNFSRSRIILGDTTIKNFRLDDCSVFSTDKGRLSYFKQVLQSVKSIHENVQSFTICISSLDAKNKPNTNYTTLRSVLYNAKRLFPNASLSVLLPCIPDDATETVRNDLEALIQTILLRSPTGCDIIQLPGNFSVACNTWSCNETEVIFKHIESFLSL